MKQIWARPFIMAALIILIGLHPASAAGEDGPPDYPARFVPALNLAALPPEARVYAVRETAARHLDWDLDQSWGRPGTIKVAVNSPDAPVLLLLMGGHPTLWQVGWTDGTRILAVLADGENSQIVTGLPPEVPVMANGQEGGWLWRSSQWALENDEKLPKPDERRDNLARKFFGRPVAAEIQRGYREVVVGRPLQPGDRILTMAVPLKETFAVERAPNPQGQAAIRRGIQLQYFREATQEDKDAWLRKRAELVRRRIAAAEQLPENLVPPYKYQDDQELLDRLVPPCRDGRPRSTCGWSYAALVYVPLKPDFPLPEKLTGLPVKFILPPNFPIPAGPLDDKVHLLLMEDGRIISKTDYQPEKAQ